MSYCLCNKKKKKRSEIENPRHFVKSIELYCNQLIKLNKRIRKRRLPTRNFMLYNTLYFNIFYVARKTGKKRDLMF